MSAKLQLLFSCEHASKKIPENYKKLFQNHCHLLETHHGYDIGSSVLTKYLSDKLQAPFLLAPWSRLLVDVNRSLYRRTLFSEITKPLLKKEKQSILDNYYYPYQKVAKQIVFERLKLGFEIFHLALHSFTPIYNGIERDVDIGILYNPERQREQEFALQWRKLLKNTRPDLRVKLNSPYRGKPDGLCARFRKEISEDHYFGFELEVNQKLYCNKKETQSINRIILSTLKLIFTHYI